MNVFARAPKAPRSILQGLDAVDWSQLHHAYGPAVDVPDLLRRLADPASKAKRAGSGKKKRGGGEEEQSVRDDVIWQLWGNVFHQGTRWQASPKTVPFLVEILAHRGADDDELARFLLSYLEHLALGYPFFPQVIDVDTYFADLKDVVDTGQSADDDERMYGVWARDCFLAVERAVDVVARFIDARDQRVSLAAVACAAHFKRRADVTLPKLRALSSSSAASASSPQEPWRIGNALVADALLAGSSALPEIEPLLTSQDPELRFHAAVAFAIADPERMPERAVEILVEAPPESVRTAFADGDAATVVSRCLERMPERHKERAVAAVAQRMIGQAPMTNLNLAATLLRLVVPNGAPLSSTHLDVAQRKALEAVRDHAPWTLGGGIFANMSNMARDFGLPSSKEELAVWLA